MKPKVREIDITKGSLLVSRLVFEWLDCSVEEDKHRLEIAMNAALDLYKIIKRFHKEQFID